MERNDYLDALGLCAARLIRKACEARELGQHDVADALLALASQLLGVSSDTFHWAYRLHEEDAVQLEMK